MEATYLSIECLGFKSFYNQFITKLADEDRYYYQVDINEDSYAIYYENYSLRTSTYLLVSIIIHKRDNNTFDIHIVGGGGNAEHILPSNLGTEQSQLKHLLKIIINIVKSNNGSFKEIKSIFKKYIEKKMKG